MLHQALDTKVPKVGLPHHDHIFPLGLGLLFCK